MTARQIFEGLLTELGKVSAPSMLLQDFNYFFNKAIAQYINTWYTYYDQNQQTTDSLRVLKATAVLDVNKVDQYSELSNFSIGKANLFNCIYEVTLPSDYQHLLNCICIYKVNKNYKCFDAGNYAQYAATRLTADDWSRVINDYFTRPLPERPYYYIHNINGNTLVPTNPYNSSEGTGTDMNGDYSVTVDQTYTITYTQDDSTTTVTGVTYYAYDSDSQTLTYYTGVSEHEVEISDIESYDADTKELVILPSEVVETVIENAGSLEKNDEEYTYTYYISNNVNSYSNVLKWYNVTEEQCDDTAEPQVAFVLITGDNGDDYEKYYKGIDLTEYDDFELGGSTQEINDLKFILRSNGDLEIYNNNTEVVDTIHGVFCYKIGDSEEIDANVKADSQITDWTITLSDSSSYELCVIYADDIQENINYIYDTKASDGTYVLTYGIRDEQVSGTYTDLEDVVDNSDGTITISGQQRQTLENVISYSFVDGILTYKQADTANSIGTVSNFTAQAETTGTSGNSNFKRTISLNTGDEADAVEKETAYRYGNASQIRMEIRYGNDDSLFTLQKVLIDYLKCPQYIRLTQEQMNLTEDTSQIMEFPDYVCQEITNILVKLVMENIGSARISNNMAINQTITPPAAAAVARSPQALAQSQK